MRSLPPGKVKPHLLFSTYLWNSRSLFPVFFTQLCSPFSSFFHQASLLWRLSRYNMGPAPASHPITYCFFLREHWIIYEILGQMINKSLDIRNEMSPEKVILNKPPHPCMNSCCNIFAHELFPLSVETSINREIILLQATHPIPEPIWPLKCFLLEYFTCFFTSSLSISLSSPSMQRKILIFHSCGNPFNIAPLFYYVETLKMCCSYNRTICPVPYHLQTVKMVPHISFFKAEYMWRQSLVTYIKNISKWKLHWGVSGCAHLCTISQVF